MTNLNNITSSNWSAEQVGSDLQGKGTGDLLNWLQETVAENIGKIDLSADLETNPSTGVANINEVMSCLQTLSQDSQDKPLAGVFIPNLTV